MGRDATTARLSDASVLRVRDKGDRPMAASSSMLELGTPLPSFSLPDTTTGRTVSSASLSGGVALIAVLCNHCPYVKHLAKDLAAFGRQYAERGLKMVAVSSNDVSTHPDDGPERMAEEARRVGYTFPYLYD